MAELHERAALAVANEWLSRLDHDDFMAAHARLETEAQLAIEPEEFERRIRDSRKLWAGRPTNRRLRSVTPLQRDVGNAVTSMLIVFATELSDLSTMTEVVGVHRRGNSGWVVEKYGTRVPVQEFADPYSSRVPHVPDSVELYRERPVAYFEQDTSWGSKTGFELLAEAAPVGAIASDSGLSFHALARGGPAVWHRHNKVLATLTLMHEVSPKSLTTFVASGWLGFVEVPSGSAFVPGVQLGASCDVNARTGFFIAGGMSVVMVEYQRRLTENNGVSNAVLLKFEIPILSFVRAMKHGEP